MSLLKEYFDLVTKYQEEYGGNTILLMQVGSFFEVYGMRLDTINNTIGDWVSSSKILEFSQICELNIVEKITCVNKNNVFMSGFKDIQIEKYIKKIQEAGYTAVVYVQDEAVKNTTRSLGGIFSPGTYFHTDTPVLSNSTTCIWIDVIDNKVLMKGKYVVIGISNIDIYTGKTTIFQFKEIYANNPTTYDELERFISIYNPSEVIMISNFSNEKEIEQVINYAGISCHLIHKINIGFLNGNEKEMRIKNCEKQAYQKEILSKFYKFNDFEVFAYNFYEHNIATQSLCFLLDFIHKHNPHLVNKISEPVFENSSMRLILANHSLKQLNIINDGAIKTNKYSCVLNMLNNCLTPMGKRKFQYNFLNPNYDENYLQREYDIIEHFLSHYTKYHAFIHNDLSSIKDLSKWERQIFLKKINPRSVCQLYNNILLVKNIFYNLVKPDPVLQEYLEAFEPNVSHIGDYCDEIAEFIFSNINLDSAKELDSLQNFETNFISYGVDEELDKKTSMLKDSEAKLEAIRSYLSSLIENREKKTKKPDTGKEYVKIHETEKNHYSLLCTSRRCKLLQDSLPKMETTIDLDYSKDCSKDYSKEIDNIKELQNIKKIQQSSLFSLKISQSQFQFEKQSSTNNFIIDPQTRDLCKIINVIKVNMKDLITKVFHKFMDNFDHYQEKLDSIIQFVTIIDLIYTKSTLAKNFNYCKPNIVSTAEKSFVSVIKLRHCLIEQFQTNEIYVTNDLTIGAEETNGILLYGTNAVGKTSFIKALGIAVIMAQAGLYVPCETFVFKPYKYIFTRIIGNDNIFKGLSTFAVEMSELRTILRLSNENSLILGDELCSGTEILSAISIFVSGIQHLHEVKSSFLFATHLHEIVNYTEITELDKLKIKHMEVVYDKERDMLIYGRILKDGPGNSMYGLEVCKSLSLPLKFLDNAYNIRMKYHPEAQSVLSCKSSHYNASKIIGLCEKCNKKIGKEVHHLEHQAAASKNGIITTAESTFHKNNLANLMTLCEDCHDAIHKSKVTIRRKKTTKGTIVL